MAAFTADYMEVINCLSVAGGVRTEPIKLPEPESLRDAGAPVGKWMGLNRPQESRTEDNIYIFKKQCKVSYCMWCFVQACSPAGYLGGLYQEEYFVLASYLWTWHTVAWDVAAVTHTEENIPYQRPLGYSKIA